MTPSRKARRMSQDQEQDNREDCMATNGPIEPTDALGERRLGEQDSASWRERLGAHLRWSRGLARQQSDGAALIACQREQRALEILARQAGQTFLLERIARVLLQVAPEAQEARFLIGQGVAGLGFVKVTAEAWQDLGWDRTRFESAYELGEDWWIELEDQLIGDDTVVGDCVVLRLQTRETAYVHADVRADPGGPAQTPPLATV
jgi:hypothetical protein